MAVTPRSPTQGRSVLELIGNTPLLRFRRIVADHDVEVCAKAEWYNPGGSVKDRAALNMILDGERRGLLTRQKILIDATSGNTGIAYAMIAAEKGYRVKLALPKNASLERKQCLQAYGAELILTDPTEGTDGAQRFVRKLVDADPDKYFYPDQYNNDANWRAHYETTAMEIWRQTEGRITHFVTGLGTTGTFMGVTRRLKELNPAIQCISMQPDAPLHGLEGLKHMATALVPGIYDPSIADDRIEVATEDAQKMVLHWRGRKDCWSASLRAEICLRRWKSRKNSTKASSSPSSAIRRRNICRKVSGTSRSAIGDLAMSSDRLILTESQIDQIEKEGEAAYPKECCGAILGRDVKDAEGIRRQVIRLEALKNSFRADEQYHRFSLDPKELIDVEKRAGEAKLNVLGFYHSHPDHPARPSEYDRTHAWPFYSYVIVEIAGRKSRRNDELAA